MTTVMTVRARFSERQLALLEAAVRVLAHSGLRGLTHRAVDREAGLPEGTCSAYMRTRLALLTRLTEYVAARLAEAIGELAGRIEQHADVEGYAVQQTAAMLHSWLLEPELLLSRLELSIEGTRQPEIAKVWQAQAQQLVDVVEHAMDSVDVEHSRARAVTLIAALDGVLLRALREPPARRADFIGETLELLMGALVGEHDQRTV